ncbi:MAG: PD-(D/E)XK nuclease family protein [Anaerolineales bacterium]
MRNLFSSVNKYTIRQTENFLTECLCYVLDVLISNEPKLGEGLLKQITGTNIEINSTTFEITTQETAEVGRPDVVISQGEDFTFFIEIKHDSTLGANQLERYFQKLAEREGKVKQLILITRSKHSLKQTRLDPKSFRHLCWYQISEWMSELKGKEKVSQYTIAQFLSFLEEKAMTNEKVEWQYIEGVPALRHLMVMLNTAIAETFPETTVVKNAGWNWIGYIVADKYWVGVRYENLLQISIETAGAKQYSPLSIINLEESHFFAHKAGEQLDKLIEFVSEGMKGLQVANTSEN